MRDLHLDKAQETAPLDFLSMLSPNGRALFSSLMRSAAQDKTVKDAPAALRYCRRELYLRTCRALSESESSAYAVTMALTSTMETAALEYAENCLQRYRPAPVVKQAKPGRRAA